MTKLRHLFYLMWG